MLENVSFEVGLGESVAIIGPNGAGKTTLLKVILGLMQPDAGTVEVLGRPVERLGELRRGIGYVPQIQGVDLTFPISVYETVLMGTYGNLGLLRRPGAAEHRKTVDALEKLGVIDLRARPIARLSGGQRQRVFLARALVNQPQLLLLDEPTTGVDVATTESLYSLLKTLKDDGMATVMVSHDIGVVANYMDTVACLNRCIVAHGRPDEVLDSDALAGMYGCDAAYFHHGRAPHVVVEEHNG